MFNGTAYKHNGLTLMELIVVVAIVGVLVSVGYPNYIRAKYETRRADATSAVVAIEGMVERHLAENNKATFDATDLALSQFADYDSGGTPTYSSKGYYRMTITTDATGYIVSATAVGPSGGLGSCGSVGNEEYKQCRDTQCREISIDHGAKISEDDAGVPASASATICW